MPRSAPALRRSLCLRAAPVWMLILGPLAALTAVESPSPAAATASGDPSVAVVAEGRETYRQRDLDALVAIAARYHHGAFTPADEDQLRHALARILIAREPLLAALSALPPAVATGKAGDAYLLDVLDYRTAAGPSPLLPPDAALPPLATEAIPTPSPAAATTPAPAVGTDAPIIVPLPPLTVVRTLPDGVRHSLQLQLALRFPDAATSQRIGAQAAIIRDAILGYLDTLSASDFTEPTQQGLKQGISAAIISQLPSFPANAVLIPELDAGRASEAAATGGAGASAPAAAPAPHQP